MGFLAMHRRRVKRGLAQQASARWHGARRRRLLLPKTSLLDKDADAGKAQQRKRECLGLLLLIVQAATRSILILPFLGTLFPHLAASGRIPAA